jgi:hypothetical protein
MKARAVFLVDCSPQIVHLATEFDDHLVEVPIPVLEPAHPGNPLPPDVGDEHGPKPVPPEAHRLVANIDFALKQQVLNISQRQRISHIHHHHQADHLG